jgi:hypothetical protein
MLRSSLIITSCIIKIRRFISRGAILRSLRNSGAFHFTRLDLGLALDLPRPHGTNGLVVRTSIGSIEGTFGTRERLPRPKYLSVELANDSPVL